MCDNNEPIETKPKSFLGKKHNLSPLKESKIIIPQTPIPNPFNLNTSLPIFKYTNEILTAIDTNQVIVIAGKTGCGKTTQVPQLIYRNAEAQNKKVKILITQPRRIAAVSIAKRLSSELKGKIGDLVGYHVGMNPYYNSEKSQIIIKTTGIFLEELVHEKNNMNNYTHLILDEVHERDINIDFVLVLVKHFLNENKNIKLILMSATISPVLFANYFSQQSIKNIKTDFETDPDYCSFENSNTNKENANTNINQQSSSHATIITNIDWGIGDSSNYEEDLYQTRMREQQNLTTSDAAPVIEIKEHTHQVYEYYINQIQQCIIDSYSKYNLQFADLPEKDKLRMKQYNFSFDKRIPCIEENMMNLCLHLIECIHRKFVEPNDKNSSVLVFLPGLGEIIAFKNYLLEHFSNIKQIEIYTLHSNVSDEEQLKVFYKIPLRKIILATNIAESSITINDTCYVIDFCLIKELQFNAKTNHESLELKWASKANCLQRGGRAGRVGTGYVFRLVNEHFFKKVLDDFPSPEILRIPLEKVILKIKVYDCGEPSVILGRAIQPPKLRSIESAIINLKNCGALTVGDSISRSGRLTELGKVYAELPIDIKYSRLIMLAYTFGLTEIGIVSAAILSQEKKLFLKDNKTRKQLYESKQFFSKGTECDVITNYNAFKEWERIYAKNLHRNEFDRKLLRRRPPGEDMWCKEKCLSGKVLREVLILTSDIKKRLSYLGVYDIDERDMIMEQDDNGNIDDRYDVSKNFRNNSNICDNEQSINIFKYVLAGAFYGKMFRSSFSDIDKIKRTRELEKKTSFESGKTITVKGLPNDLNEENLKLLFNQYCPIQHFEFQSQEARIGFAGPNAVDQIKLILFLGSNHVLNNQELAVTYRDSQTFLRKPDYLYELAHTDIFSYSKVDVDADSINHIVIEQNDRNIPLIIFTCDNYYQRKTKYTARYTTRLPNKPMVEILLTLIFTPFATFKPNSNETRYASFTLEGSNVEFTFNYLFSSVDVKDINSIRAILNKLVKTKDIHQKDFDTLREQLITNITKLIEKKRLKILKKEHYDILVTKFFGDNTQETNLRYNDEIDPEEIKQKEKEKMLPKYLLRQLKKKTSTDSSFTPMSNDFLQPLRMLTIKEDFRSWTESGMEELQKERERYTKMREKILANIEMRKNMINQKTPYIYCKRCNEFLCSVNNIRPHKDIGYHLSIWAKFNEIDPLDESIQNDFFILEYKNRFENLPSKFFTCFSGKHIIGFKMNNEYYLTDYSGLSVELPGGKNTKWGFYVFTQEFKELLQEALKEREKNIDTILECELCKKTFFNEEGKGRINTEEKYLEHLKTKEHLNAIRELQEEIFE